MAALTPDEALALTQSCLTRARGRRWKRALREEVARLQTARSYQQLAELAEAADAERADQPDYRRDTDG